MKKMTSFEIRQTWLKFFEAKQHEIIKSASLIPNNDPTLLWINAGVSPLKALFDGTVKPQNPRLANVQKCVRTNDIDNVGKTARHHTFFEMLGNFSIGEYFKKEAIAFAYELLISEQYFAFDKELLYFTYYPTDLDTKNLWLELGIEDNHLIPVEGNYWEIGPGPSGPDTEIFFDRGSSYDQRGPELIKEDIENERYIEIWNIVFSQYNAKENTARENYEELPHKNIDTGAGLERFACVLQSTKTNFETDLFYPIIKSLEKITNINYDGQVSFKVIADHIKALVMMISDGAVFANEGRGYILRRLLRRSLKYGRTLGLNDPFMYKLVESVNEIMGLTYPEVLEMQGIVQKLIKKEEQKFLETLISGEKKLQELLLNNSKISGEDCFKLYDTYGFPIELTKEYANEAGLEIDEAGFYESLEVQKRRSKDGRTNKTSMNEQNKEYLNCNVSSEFIGYDTYKISAKVMQVFSEGIVLDKTPFYATKGGQVCDSGTINGYDVLDVILLPNGQHLHKLNSKDGFNFGVNDLVECIIDLEKRNLTCANHSATHLLQYALQEVLGLQVKQQGSRNNEYTTRFDYNNYEEPKLEELLKIEEIVNELINQELAVEVTSMSLKEAQALGAKALFEDKYGEIVRVVKMGPSIELCGGTHVVNTKLIKHFMIISNQSIGSGTYRIECITGDIKNKVFNYLPQGFLQALSKYKELFNKDFPFDYSGSYLDLINAREVTKEINKKIMEFNQQNSQLGLQNLVAEYIKKHEKHLKKQVVSFDNIDIKDGKLLLDLLFNQLDLQELILLITSEEKVNYFIKSASNNAKKIINAINELSSGRGGGKDSFATGASTNKAELLDNIEKLSELL